MGSRANYVLIENGAITVYFSQWGAMSVPAVVISGPAETSVYIRGLLSADRLFNDTWAEGGILLNADTRTLLFFGGGTISKRPDLRRTFLRAMRLVWQGWSISWATHGIVDIAEYPGVAVFLEIDPASVRDNSEYAFEKAYPEQKIRDPHRNPWITTVITVKWDDGRVMDYTFDDFADGYLTYGPALLDILRERKPDALLREDGDGQHFPLGGAYIDVATQTLWIWGDSTLSPAYLEYVAHVWAGWRVEGHLDGLARQVALSGRNSALVTVPMAQVIAELLRELTNDGDVSYPFRFAQGIEARSEPDTTRFAPGFFRMDTPLTSAAERHTYLAALLQRALQEDTGADASAREV